MSMILSPYLMTCAFTTIKGKENKLPVPVNVFNVGLTLDRCQSTIQYCSLMKAPRKTTGKFFTSCICCRNIVTFVRPEFIFSLKVRGVILWQTIHVHRVLIAWEALFFWSLAITAEPSVGQLIIYSRIKHGCHTNMRDQVEVWQHNQTT